MVLGNLYWIQAPAEGGDSNGRGAFFFGNLAAGGNPIVIAWAVLGIQPL